MASALQPPACWFGNLANLLVGPPNLSSGLAFLPIDRNGFAGDTGFRF